MKIKKSVLVTVAAFLSLAATAFTAYGQQPDEQAPTPAPALSGNSVQPRIKGLETNSEYMRLLEEERTLLQREDSLNNVIAGVRELFRTDPDNRQTTRDRIMKLENEVFELRSRIGSISFDIGAIEQDFILNNLDSLPSGGDSPQHGPNLVSGGEETSADLVMNPFFRAHLPAADYRALTEAQQNEAAVVSYLDIYRINYTNMQRHATSYADAGDAVQADSVFTRYDNLREVNERIADTVAMVWGRVFDDKIYAYNYLLDKENERALLRNMEDRSIIMRERLAALRPEAMSEAVSSYGLQKQLLLEYEITLARLFGYNRSLDSLTQAVEEFDAERYDLPAINFKERFFLDFADIATASPPKYNSRNPIPAVTVHKRGVIYRIQVGSYTRVQPVSLFKGLYPLAYLHEGSRYIYLAGGYETVAAASEGLEKVKKLGFRNARIAEFNFGRYTVLDESPTAEGDTMYRVEISGVGSKMPAEVTECIDLYAPDKDIARTTNGFSVGPFNSQADAATLRDALTALDAPLAAVMTEISL